MIWLDHAATSLPRLDAALAAAARASAMATPGRGHHGPAREATATLEHARATVVAHFGGLRTVCFGSGATFALNTAIAGWRPRPRRIAIDPWAHNAVLRPVARLGVERWVLPTATPTTIDLQETARAWPSDVDLLVVSHASNVTGAILPVAELIELAHRRGAAVVVDAAQTIGVLDPEPLGDADAIAFSGHKGLRVPPGIGALVLTHSSLVEPISVGGTGHDALVEIAPAELPARLEPGTPNLPGIAALATSLATDRASAALDRAAELFEVIARAGFEPIGARGLPIAAIAGPIDPGELEDALDRGWEIATRSGLHCAPLAHQTLGTFPGGALRISTGATTTADDLHALGEALSTVRRTFGVAPRGAVGERGGP